MAETLPEVAAVHTPATREGMLAALGHGRTLLIEARDDLERMFVHDRAKAVAAAAEALKLADVQTVASELVADCRRAIAKANPPTPPTGKGRGNKLSAPPDNLDKRRLSDMRAEHDGLDDDEYEAVKSEARAKQQPVTGAALKAKARAKRAAEVQQVADERRIKREGLERSGAWRVEHCSINDLDVADGSVDAIVTDPPWTRATVGVFEDLGRFAAAKLRPGGTLLTMTGTVFIPDALDLIRRGAEGTDLGYAWTLAYTGLGAGVMNCHHRIAQRWRAVLMFTRGRSTWGDGEPRPTYPDLVDAAEDHEDRPGIKAGHRWGQGLAGFVRLVEIAAAPGELVVDVFCGSGTTGVAALARGCEFIGCDIDEAAVTAARERLSACAQDN